jgi:hypothetical protein
VYIDEVTTKGGTGEQKGWLSGGCQASLFTFDLLQKRVNVRAVIALTTHLGADRTGRTYDGSLLPDQPVAIDWSEVGTSDDPVLQAAIAWLSTEEDCLPHNEQAH